MSLRMEPVRNGVNVHTKIDKKVRAAIMKIATDKVVDQTVVYNTVLKRGLAAVGTKVKAVKRKSK
jgi:hypothetical protein